jgi:hypothetical protein
MHTHTHKFSSAPSVSSLYMSDEFLILGQQPSTSSC